MRLSSIGHFQEFAFWPRKCFGFNHLNAIGFCVFMVDDIISCLYMYIVSFWRELKKGGGGGGGGGGGWRDQSIPARMAALKMAVGFS